MKTKEIELSISEVEINGRIIPIVGRVDIKFNMKTNEVGKKQLKYFKKGNIVLIGSIKKSEPLSPKRTSRSWNMNIEVKKEDKL
jgi:hypothetical protein